MSFLSGMGIDLEDYYHASIFDNLLSQSDKDVLPSRVKDGTYILLDILEKYNIKSTFFCLGLVAKSYPNLIKEIAKRGHEIAAHSMLHKRVYSMSSHEFAIDTIDIKSLLEDITGQKILGYRAPSFSINAQTEFFYPTLIEQGFIYSSSLNPIKHDHYGDEAAPRFAFHPLENNKFLEIPVSTIEYKKKRFAIGGGGWFRFLPYMLFKYLSRQVNKEAPLIFYTHPWEFVEDQPYIESLSMMQKFRHYYNIAHNAEKFERLCKDFQWGRMIDLEIIQ